jgi:hypothetical protein
MIKLTISWSIQVNNMITNPDIYDAKKTLISLFEFFLIKNLDGKDTVFGNLAAIGLVSGKLEGWEVSYRSKLSFQ